MEAIWIPSKCHVILPNVFVMFSEMPRNGRLQPRKKATFKSETTESRGAFTHFPSPPGMEPKRRCRIEEKSFGVATRLGCMPFIRRVREQL